MGFLGISGNTWKNIGKIALKAAPIAAAPFTGGSSLLALGAGTGAVSGALDGGGWKGAALGGGLGAIPGLGSGAKGANVFTNYLGKAGSTSFGGFPIAGGGGLKDTLLQMGSNVLKNVAAPTGRAAASTGTGLPPQTGGSTPPPGSSGGGFWGTYGPLIAQGAGMVVGGLAGKKATSMAQKRSPEEQVALSGAQGAAGQLGRFGGRSVESGYGYATGPAQYYQSLLSGNRAAANQAVAGPAAQLTGVYRGAERNLDQQGVRGAARDVASADLNRDRASKIAGLVTGVQPYAANQLAELGTTMMGQGGAMLGTSGSIYGNLLQQGASNRAYARNQGQQTAEAIGGLSRDIGETVFKKTGQGGTATTSTGKAPAKAKGGASTPPPAITETAPITPTKATPPWMPPQDPGVYQGDYTPKAPTAFRPSWAGWAA